MVGEPGVGKSRLFWELLHSHRVHSWLIVQSASVSYGKATAYLPVIELLRSYFEIESRDDPRKIREKVTGKVLTLALREAIAHLEQALAALRRLPEARETTELTIDIHIDLRNALLPLGDLARQGEHLRRVEVLARALGDQRRLARIATFMGIQCLITGDYGEAVRSGREALSIARTLSDRSIEAVATMNLGLTYAARGEFSDAAAFLERNVALEDDLRYERFGATFIPSARSGADLADVLSQLGRFDEAIGHAEAAVRIAETVDHPYTLYWGLFDLGRVHLRRGISDARHGSSSDASTSAERGSSFRDTTRRCRPRRRLRPRRPC